RDVPAAPVATTPPRAVPDVLSDPDSLRELVHEIKTPLNAIMGFAEIIEGQYLGPADRGYRERASEIGRQARLLLTAIDDLDFAAKVHSAKGSMRERVDLGALVDRAASELRDIASKRGIEAAVVPARGRQGRLLVAARPRPHPDCRRRPRQQPRGFRPGLSATLVHRALARPEPLSISMATGEGL